MTVDEARALPPVIDVTTYARLMGIGRGLAYREIAAGKVDVVKVGGAIRVLTAPALRRLGLEPR